ncbi:MAG: hypothetical protein GY853_06735, partial [PVC group bacterium]|nr:hypothetical protein [PVC group bacterium]
HTTDIVPTVSSVDKIRIDKIREDKNNNRWIKNNPPTLEQLEAYKTEKSLSIDCVWFLDYFTTGDWIDAKGNKVKNWKQKMLTHAKMNFNDDRPPSEKFGIEG